MEKQNFLPLSLSLLPRKTSSTQLEKLSIPIHASEIFEGDLTIIKNPRGSNEKRREEKVSRRSYVSLSFSLSLSNRIKFSKEESSKMVSVSKRPSSFLRPRRNNNKAPSRPFKRSGAVSISASRIIAAVSRLNQFRDKFSELSCFGQVGRHSEREWLRSQATNR